MTLMSPFPLTSMHNAIIFSEFLGEWKFCSFLDIIVILLVVVCTVMSDSYIDTQTLQYFKMHGWGENRLKGILKLLLNYFSGINKVFRYLTGMATENSHTMPNFSHCTYGLEKNKMLN